METRKTSGLVGDDLMAAKIYMRTLTDALTCANDIAVREAAKVHFKDYVKTLVDSMKTAPMVVDKNGAVVSATNHEPLTVYRLMTFSQEIVSRYGLSSESIKDANDLNSRLDRAIKGLETEIGLK